MRPHGIVVAPPVSDNDLCFDTVPEPFHGKAFVAEFAIEAFRRPVLPWLDTTVACSLVGVDDHHRLPDAGHKRIRFVLRCQFPICQQQGFLRGVVPCIESTAPVDAVAACGDCAAMKLDQFLYNCKAKPEAAPGPRQAALSLRENLENVASAMPQVISRTDGASRTKGGPSGNVDSVQQFKIPLHSKPLHFPRRRQPVATVPITESSIHKMVDMFYARAREDDVLSPVFERTLAGKWDEHMPRMYAFWEKILLGTGNFQGNVFAKHMALAGIEEEHFVRWLSLFRRTAMEVFGTDDAKIPIQAAERIASSFQLGFFGKVLA
jgi:hemoglobin